MTKENDKPGKRTRALTHKQFAMLVEVARLNADSIRTQTSWPALAEHLTSLVKKSGSEFAVGPHAARDCCNFADITPAIRQVGGSRAVIEQLQTTCRLLTRQLAELWKSLGKPVPAELTRLLDKEE